MPTSISLLEFTAFNEVFVCDEDGDWYPVAEPAQATWVSCLLTDKPDIGCYPVMPY